MIVNKSSSGEGEPLEHDRSCRTKGSGEDRDELTMEDIQQVRTAFHETRIIGEKLLSEGKICWEAFSIFMITFEEKLRSMGEAL